MQEVESQAPKAPDFDQGFIARAWEDTKRASSRWWRFRIPAAALTVGFAVWGALLPSNASTAARVGGAVLGTVGGALIIGVVLFVVSLVLAPIRQRDEARARAWELGGDLDELSVSLEGLRLYEPQPDADDAGSLLVVISSARITNRSPANRVSLGLRFVVHAVGGELWMNEASDQKWKQFAGGDDPPERLTTPLSIEPQNSEQGTLGFWLSEAFASVITPHLKAAVEAEGVARINPRLVIQDYVSDRSITVPVPGSHL